MECLLKMCQNNQNLCCPVDKNTYNSPILSLPTCYAILSHLPKTRSKKNKPLLGCKKHPDKKIKFKCEIHNEFLCANCVLEHTGPDHKICSYEINCIFLIKFMKIR